MKQSQNILVFLVTIILLLYSVISVSARSEYSPLPPLKTTAKEPSCTSQGCHPSIKIKMEQSLHHHPGILEGEGDHSCLSCHLEEGLSQRRLSSGGITKIHDPSLRNIHIVQVSDLTPLTKYQFRIQSADSGGKTVVMESDDFVFTTASPSSKAISSTPQTPADPTPPQIMEVIVEDIQWGPLISAKISWKTDKPSTSKIEYGITPSFGSSTPVDFSPVVDHLMTIRALRPGTTYYFRVHSGTPSGYHSTSSTLTFTIPSSKTSFFFQKQFSVFKWLTHLALAQSSSSPLFITKISISRVTEKTAMITWETNRPTDTLLEYQAIQQVQETKQFIHPILRNKETVGLETCYGCHPKEKLGVSHPVRVRLRPEMMKPKDLPLGEKGTILCTTCHDPHGGSQRFLVRKDRKRELCISCHDPEKIQFKKR